MGSYPKRGGARKSRRRRPGAPRPDALVAEFHAMEEKGSDVNLAAHLLNDAWMGLFDAAAVISNDTDLVTPVRMVTAERGKPVFIVVSGTLAGRSEAEAGGEPCAAYPARASEGRAVSGQAAGPRHREAGGGGESGAGAPQGSVDFYRALETGDEALDARQHAALAAAGL